MLQPARTAYRKQHRMRNNRTPRAGSQISFGSFGLQATDRGTITARQIEAARRAITRCLKREGKVYIRVFPDKPFTKKPLGVRMGRGKAGVEFWGMFIQPGRVIYEIGGISDMLLAKRALELGAAKLPFKARFVQKLNIPIV